MTHTIPALVMAGSRPGPDPLLTGTNVSTKALLPVAGQAMLVHVVSALRASPLVGPISRAVPSMPLAPPAWWAGAEVTRVKLLGDWNSAKPAPHTAMHTAT